MSQHTDKDNQLYQTFLYCESGIHTPLFYTVLMTGTAEVSLGSFTQVTTRHRRRDEDAKRRLHLSTPPSASKATSQSERQSCVGDVYDHIVVSPVRDFLSAPSNFNHTQTAFNRHRHSWQPLHLQSRSLIQLQPAPLIHQTTNRKNVPPPAHQVRLRTPVAHPPEA